MKPSHALRALLAVPLLLAAQIGAAGPPTSPGFGAERDRERGTFAACRGARRVTCVVDGDTIWYQGEKIRIADINAPELSHPSCAYEKDLAQDATDRLTVLLNAGAFALAPWPRRHIDQYGRSLYVIERGGGSLGMVLVREGLAERWKGYRGNWCADDRA